MNITPKVRANISSIVTMMPYIVLVGFHRELLSAREQLYLTVVSLVVSLLVYQWVYHRYASRLPAPALPKAELSLVVERLPKVVWLAWGPPMLAAALLWWVTAYGAELPWRDTWLASPTPAPTHRDYRFAVLSIVVWNSLSLWMVLWGLAIWHGMSRAYQFRRSFLLHTLLNQWLMLAGSVSWEGVFLLRLPDAAAVPCGIVYAASMCAVIWSGSRTRRLYAGSPRTGTWWYFDSRDPSFLGPRGLNAASPWCWALIAACITPVLLIDWILRAVPA